MTNTDLLALVCLVNSERSQRVTANAVRIEQGLALAYDETESWPSLDALRAEILRRGILESEADESAAQGVLNWLPTPGSNSPLIAESRGSRTSPYYLISVLRDGVQKWTVRRECVEHYVGTANECMAWCESIEAKLPTTTG